MSHEPSIREQYIQDSNLMLRYALNKGIAVPSSIVKTLESYILKDSVDRGECAADSVHYDEKVVGDLKSLETEYAQISLARQLCTTDDGRSFDLPSRFYLAQYAFLCKSYGRRRCD